MNKIVLKYSNLLNLIFYDKLLEVPYYCCMNSLFEFLENYLNSFEKGGPVYKILVMHEPDYIDDLEHNNFYHYYLLSIYIFLNHQTFHSLYIHHNM